MNDKYIELKTEQLTALKQAREIVKKAKLKDEWKYLSRKIHNIQVQISIHNNCVKGDLAYSEKRTRINYGKPFKEFSDEERKEYNAEKSRKYRERKKNDKCIYN